MRRIAAVNITLGVMGALAGIIWLAGAAASAEESIQPFTPLQPGVAGAAAGSSEINAWYVVLEGGGAVKAHLEAGAATGRVKAVRDRLAAIDAQHAALAPRLAALGAAEVYRFRRLTNAIQVLAPASAVPALQALPGVVRVEPAPHHTPTNSTSVPILGAPELWNSTGLNIHGEGIRIGIIDTGIDYLHANFGGAGNPADYDANDSTVIEPGTFPTARVVGGHDFCGDNYNSGSNNPSQYTPFPDPDPLDCQGHGSHVGGTAAGGGVLNDGSAYTGPYSPGLNPGDFLIGPGVAPAAQIFALKVFGCVGSTQLAGAALEWAADPNDDGDFSDHLDVVNLSLGSSYGAVFFTEGEIVSQLSELGCAVVGSAGNSYDTFFVTGSVGVAPEAISVAASYDSEYSTVDLEITSPPALAGSFQAIEARFTPPLSGTGDLAASIILAEPSLGCQSLANGAAINGQIALIDRGGCGFPNKVLAAQNAGAIAAVIVNHQDGLPLSMTGDADGVTIPAVMISRSDGELIKAHLGGGVSGTLHAASTPRPEFARQIIEFSSRGPVPGTWNLKPDVSAPGYQITSTAVGTGFESELLAGTSMAAPHVAGAMGLLRQAFPEAPVSELKARLMNAARDMFFLTHPLPESRGGAGLAHVFDAAHLPVTAAWDAAPGQVSISLGFQRLLEPHEETHSVRLTNHSAQEHTFSVSVRETVSETGVTITPLVTQVTVPPHGTALAQVHVAFTPALFDRTSDPATAPQFGEPRASIFEVSGLLLFEEGDLSLRLPYHGIVEAAALRQPPGVVYLGGNGGNAPASPEAAVSGVEAVTIPLSGPSAHPSPFVSAFVLGAESPNENHDDPHMAAADLIAVGAATDLATAADYPSARLYFGIATAADRAAPRWQFGYFVVWIDIGGNGTYEYFLYNADVGYLYGNSSSDAFATILLNYNTSASFVIDPINVLPMDDRETGFWNNNVLILSVPFQALGLHAGSTEIKYVVDSYRLGYTFLDSVGPISFNAQSRPIDPAPHGIGGAPVFSTDVPSIQVAVDRDALMAAPDANKLLVFQHHNPPDHRVRIVEFSLDAPPAIPDGWMLTGAP